VLFSINFQIKKFELFSGQSCNRDNHRVQRDNRRLGFRKLRIFFFRISGFGSKVEGGETDRGGSEIGICLVEFRGRIGGQLRRGIAESSQPVSRQTRSPTSQT